MALLKTELKLSGRKTLILLGCTRRPDGKIGNAGPGADDAAKRLRPRRQLQPLVQRAALICLEVTVADPAYARRINDPGDGLPNLREQATVTRLKEQRLVVLEQKLAEL